MRRAGVEAFVLSREVNPVVAARCHKLGIPFIQGETDKANALQALLFERKIDPANVVYVGNDINDLPCFPLVGCAVAVADALPEVCAQADLVLQQRGGHGAVREICDLIYEKTRGANIIGWWVATVWSVMDNLHNHCRDRISHNGI
jgi:N-acylneuraminate cytidylyltransferase